MGRNRKILAGFLFAAVFFSAQVFAQGNKPTTLQADVIVYDSTTGISTAEGNVVISQEDGVAKAASAEYNMNTKTGVLMGGVTANKGEATLSASTVHIYDQNYVVADGSAYISKAGDSVSAPRIDYWSDKEFAKTSGGWGKLSQKDGSVLTANYIEYDMKKGLALAQNNVEINSPPRNLTGAGDKATYTVGTKEKPGEIILSGNAWVIQDGNKIIGNSLIIKSDSSSSEAKGNVRMDITPKAKKDETNVETKQEK